jgi:hypothetical protein
MERFNKNYIFVIAIVSICIVAAAVSGCSFSKSFEIGTPTATPQPGSTTTPGGTDDKMTVTQSGDTITITGTKKAETWLLASNPFNLVAGAYIYTFTNEGGEDFTASIRPTASDTGYLLAMMDGSSGEDYMLVGSGTIFDVAPGQAVLEVSDGDTFTVTLTRLTAADSPPVTVSGQSDESKFKAVSLAAGAVTVTVTHSEFKGSDQASTIVQLINVETGEKIYLDNNWIKTETGEATGEITELGLYVLAVDFSNNSGGEATLTQ